MRRLRAIGRRSWEGGPRWWPTPLWALHWYASGHTFARVQLGKNRVTAIPQGFRSLRAAWMWATRDSL